MDAQVVREAWMPGAPTRGTRTSMCSGADVSSPGNCWAFTSPLRGSLGRLLRNTGCASPAFASPLRGSLGRPQGGLHRERSPLSWERAPDQVWGRLCARSSFASSFAGRLAPTEALARTGVQHGCYRVVALTAGAHPVGNLPIPSRLHRYLRIHRNEMTTAAGEHKYVPDCMCVRDAPAAVEHGADRVCQAACK